MFLEKEITKCSNNGHLYLDLRQHLDVYLKYSSWEAGLFLYRWNGSQWEPEYDDPNIPLIQPEYENNPLFPIYDFIKAIPQDIRNKISIFDYLQTSLLQISSRCEASIDLLCDIPILLWIIVEAFQNEIISFENAKRLVSKKRKEILQELLKKGTNSDVKFLKKIKLLHGTKYELQIIKNAVQNNRLVFRFRHWETIPIHILAVIECCPNLFESKLIQLLADKHYEQLADAVADTKKIQMLWQDIFYMTEVLNLHDAVQRMNDCKTVEALEQLHDSWVALLNQQKVINGFGEPFPMPPIPGNNDIYPILNSGDLMAEGKLMHHCVSGYVNKIKHKECYIYRVIRPERATLEIRGSEKSARIGQLKLSCNQMPSHETFAVVSDWFENYKKMFIGKE